LRFWRIHWGQSWKNKQEKLEEGKRSGLGPGMKPQGEPSMKKKKWSFMGVWKTRKRPTLLEEANVVEKKGLGISMENTEGGIL